MKICVWFEVTDKPWGGGNQFLRALSRVLRDSGHEVVHDPEPGTDAVLLNSHNTGPNKRLYPWQVAQLKYTGRASLLGRFIPPAFRGGARRGPALVHRLDGVPCLIRGVRSKADDIIPAVNRHADFTIFQSEYSRESWAGFGVQPAGQRIIHNGVDPDIFFPPPAPPPAGPTLRLLAASWSANPRKGFADIARISLEPGVEMRFAGNWCRSVPPGKTVMLGALDSKSLAAEMRNCDAFVHAAENEPCSNAILEALASGLPVLFRDSGGNRELAGNFGVPLTGDHATDIARLRGELAELRARTLAENGRFLVADAARQYDESLKAAVAMSRGSAR